MSSTTALQGSTPSDTQGSILASATPITPSSPAVDLTKPERDGTTVVCIGGSLYMTILDACAQGRLARGSHGGLYEISQPQPPAVSIGGVPQTTVEAPIEPQQVPQQQQPERPLSLVQRIGSLLRL